MKFPSNNIELESLQSIIEDINELIEDINYEIKENNNIFLSKEKTKQEVNNQVWLFLFNIYDNEIKEYIKKYNQLNVGLDNIEKSIKMCIDKENSIQKEIENQEANLTNVRHSCNEINKILLSFGFDNFKLDVVEDEKAYKIIRHSGEDAKNTLSEGEKNFLTFLYFYHLIHGSLESTGIGNDKIVVIDDPISSLDSGFLFVVSTLIRKLVLSCLRNKNGIIQIFVLTHNIFFFKEVTYKCGDYKDNNSNAYWTIIKKDKISNIIYHGENPIKSSYELLWAQLRNITHENVQIVFNAMRRILEFYSRRIGHVNIDLIIEQNDGENKILCKALLSMINAGSHEISDDFYVIIAPEELERYLIVFRKIFVILNHEDHYEMMMQKET